MRFTPRAVNRVMATTAVRLDNPYRFEQERSRLAYRSQLLELQLIEADKKGRARFLVGFVPALAIPAASAFGQASQHRPRTRRLWRRARSGRCAA